MKSILKLILLLVLVLILMELDVFLERRFDIKIYKHLFPKYYDDGTYGDIDLSKSDYPPIIFDQIERGKKEAKNKNIAICCLCRNIEPMIEKSKKKLEKIGNCFKDYKIILFENDSADNTRNLLKEWRADNDKVILLECDEKDCIMKTKHGYDPSNKQRLKKMAEFRQRYLDYVKQNETKFDYMLVIDIDIEGNQVFDGLFHSIGQDQDWGAIFINGRNPIPLFNISWMYDKIAYVPYKFPLEDILCLNQKLASFMCNMELYLNNDLHRVISAFNGYGLYKVSALKKCSYIGNEKLCEHVNLNMCMHLNGEKLYINPLWKGYFTRQGPRLGPISSQI